MPGVRFLRRPVPRRGDRSGVILKHEKKTNHRFVFFLCHEIALDRKPGVGAVLVIELLLPAVDDGGKFICHICGHTHWDLIVKSTTYPDQLCVVIDALSRSQGNQYSDTQRTDATKSQDLANLIAFDTSSGVIKIIRIGASIDHYLREKNCITINYNTGAIITQN